MIQQVVMTMNEKSALHFCLYTNEVGVLWYCTAFDSTKLRRTVLYAVTVLLCSTVRYGVTVQCLHQIDQQQHHHGKTCKNAMVSPLMMTTTTQCINMMPLLTMWGFFSKSNEK
jgi:hypothetical protein